MSTFTTSSSTLAADEPALWDAESVRSHGVDDLLINRRDLSGTQRHAIEELAFRHASVPESYDIAVSDGHLLKTPCGRGAVSVLADGRYWHIAGGLLAPNNLQMEMVYWLHELSRQNRRTVAVYNVSEADAYLFYEAGFVVNKFGEEPLVDLKDGSWTGKKFEWVRRQSNYCTRAGIDVSEVTGADQQMQMADTLVSIMSDDLAGRTFDKPLRLLEGEFNPHALMRRRLFVARSGHNGQVEAFLACSPINGGRSWAFETYRKRSDATRGVTAHLFRTVMDQLKEEGTQTVSLCLIPGRNVQNSAMHQGDWRIEKALSLWFNRLDFVFNAKGQDHFKSRFRPRYVNRYLCVAPQNTVRSLWSFFRTTGAMNCNWANMVRQYRKSKSG